MLCYTRILSCFVVIALTQAGRHMEDSIISSYSALLLAVLAKHSSVS